MAKTSPYAIGLEKTEANFTALSPVSFLARTSEVYPDLVAVIHEDRHFTWAETAARARRLASALVKAGVEPGDTVAVMLPNVPAMVEAHFGVPMTGAVLNGLNTRLNDELIAFMLDHSETKIVLTDPEYADVMERAIGLLKGPRPLVVDVMDASFANGRAIGDVEYEDFIAGGDPTHPMRLPADEWDAIALGYTSGTTGNPKGVVTHHRGAYLNAVSNVLGWGVPQHAVYLWTLPMFHCNGWCFPWTMAAVAGTNICLRRVDPVKIFELIKRHKVTHYCGAPIVHTMMAEAPAESRSGLPHRIKGMVAGAAPSVALFERMESIGIDLTHVYGLTETYGPAVVCANQPAWAGKSAAERAQLNGRQGVRYPLEEGVTVMDPETMQPVPADGETIGEIMFRGNIVMKGYLKNEAATEEALSGGWFHSGDLAVLQPDGYIKIRDRSKDVIISGGENISSLEVEDILCKHPAVLAAAVVAKNDEKWGEVPAAFIELRGDHQPTAAEMTAFCREHLAHYKVPKHYVFGPLQRTSTGKVQKFALRDKLKLGD